MAEDETPELVLRRAAEAAVRMLPAMEMELANRMKAVEDLNRRITQLRNLASLFEAEPNIEVERSMQQAIDHVLITAGPMRVGDLREQLQPFIGRAIAESTLYSYLSKGKIEGRYANENNRWSLVRPRMRQRVTSEGTTSG